MQVLISGMGGVSPLGTGMPSMLQAILGGGSHIWPIRLFSVAGTPLPVGACEIGDHSSGRPRTHRLARMAAEECMARISAAPDAVVVGTTTGGMLESERHLRKSENDPAAYRYHAAGSVAEDLAGRFGCTGPVVTVSTACSSGAAAIAVAREMLRSGMCKRVLAGGVDSLCRLTYYGFHSLQLIDPRGARPLDGERRGMSVAEGAAMLLLETDVDPAGKVALRGAGLSCDAYHPTAPHPRGTGATKAVRRALLDARCRPADIDYVNLHGTGTLDNDAAEVQGLLTVFGADPPPMSSLKGAMGHSLAASGAIEAALSAVCIQNSLIPANVGCRTVDSKLHISPPRQPLRRPLQTVLSNSFGFGGNNAALVIGRLDDRRDGPDDFLQDAPPTALRPLRILAGACITGAGNTDRSISKFFRGDMCAGLSHIDDIAAGLPARKLRRLKRLPRMALSLANASMADAAPVQPPESVFLGTGWGALSETHDFLMRLFETEERYPGPTDFVGSVHNAAAGHVARHFQAAGANITTTGGDVSFEQSLLAADLLTARQTTPFWVMGVDEYHHRLSPLFDPSAAVSRKPADGGGALLIQRRNDENLPAVKLRHFAKHTGDPDRDVRELVEKLGGPSRMHRRYGLMMIGMPAGCRDLAQKQLCRARAGGMGGAIIDYRKYTGEFATASAVAVVWAAEIVKTRKIPAFIGGAKGVLNPRGVLILGFGPYVTAMEVIA